MEKQLKQFMNNVKTYCKRLAMLALSVSFAAAALITVGGEAARNVLSFKQVNLSNNTKSNVDYALGDIVVEDYGTIQNHLMVADALCLAGEIEPAVAGLEEKETEMVASSYNAPSADPTYADPTGNGYEFIGTYLTTGYCACAKCCGKTNGVTASGKIATANHTIAADTSVLPFGTQVVINGQVYTVEDRGGAIKGNRIDIFFASHQEALIYGKRYVNVYRYVGNGDDPVEEENTTEASSDAKEDSTETTEGSTETTEGSTEATEGSTEAVEESTEPKPATEEAGNTFGRRRRR